MSILKIIILEQLNINNIVLNSIIIDWLNKNDPLLSITDKRKEILQNYDIIDDIQILLKNENIKIQLITLIIIVDLNIDYDSIIT